LKKYLTKAFSANIFIFKPWKLLFLISVDVFTHNLKSLSYSFRFASYYRDTLNIKAHDVVHIMIGGNNFGIPFAVLGALAIGAVPAFGELWLPEDTLIVQVWSYALMK
jgi:hypothetical protein